VEITVRCYAVISSGTVPLVYGCMFYCGGRCAGGLGRQFEAVRKRGGGGGGGGRETSSLSLVNLKYSGYRPFLPACQHIFHNGNSYFHIRHLFFRKRLDSMLKLSRKYINHSGFAVHKKRKCLSLRIGSPHSLPRERVWLPPQDPSGGGEKHSLAGGGGTQSRRRERNSGTPCII
jgi:hypothetical protein